MRLLIYTTDFDGLMQHYGLFEARLASTTPKPTIIILGVNLLVFPELLVGIEAAAVK